jgi:hypothetical protein
MESFTKPEIIKRKMKNEPKGQYLQTKEPSMAQTKHFFRKFPFNGLLKTSSPSKSCNLYVLFEKTSEILKGPIHRASNFLCFPLSYMGASHLSTKYLISNSFFLTFLSKASLNFC